MTLFTQSTTTRDSRGIVLQPGVKHWARDMQNHLPLGGFLEREGSEGLSGFEALEGFQEYYAAEEVADS